MGATGVPFRSIQVLYQRPGIRSPLVVEFEGKAKEVADKVAARLSVCKKPVVCLFLGEKPEYYEEGFYQTYTLDECARLAVSLVRGQKVEEGTVDCDRSRFFKKESNRR